MLLVLLPASCVVLCLYWAGVHGALMWQRCSCEQSAESSVPVSHFDPVPMATQQAVVATKNTSKWLIRVTVTIWWLLIYLSASISLFFKLPFLFLFFSSFPCLLSCFGGVATCSHLWTEWGVRAPLVWDQNLTFTSSTETGMNSFFWNGLFYKNTCLFPAAPPALSAEWFSPLSLSLETSYCSLLLLSATKTKPDSQFGALCCCHLMKKKSSVAFQAINQVQTLKKAVKTA